MNGNQPTVVSLFAGTGGSSLGYKNAGFKELLAIDFDDHAEICFKLNFPEVPFLKIDITKISGQQILDKIGLKQGELDCLDGSPPCQGFSMAGKRQVLDPRNTLLSHYVRLINEIKPKSFVMENVPGMVEGRMKGLWKEFWKSLPHNNYKINAKILNAKFYGVPQSRKRVFIIGANKISPEFPKQFEEIINAGQALNGIKPSDVLKLSVRTQKLFNEVKRGGNGSEVLGIGKGFSTIKLAKHKPCQTILKSGAGMYLHFEEARPLAINEALILTSFPETWKMEGTYREKWARIGNSVPPKLMEAVAKVLKSQLEGTYVGQT